MGRKKASVFRRALLSSVKNTAISKLVYETSSLVFIERMKMERPHSNTADWRFSGTSTKTTGNPLARPNTLLIDSEQLEAGDALDDKFRGMAADEIERFRREIAERTGDQRKAESITDQELLREVMNTVGKFGTLGGSIRCVVFRLDADRRLGRPTPSPMFWVSGPLAPSFFASRSSVALCAASLMN